MKMKQSSEKVFSIPAPKIESMMVRIKGTSPLIFHKWSEKAKRQILDKQMKKASKGRDVRDPEAEYLNSIYYDKDGDIAFPALSLKQAVINAVRNLPELTMTQVRGAVFIVGDMDGFIKVLVKGKPIKPSAKIKVLDEENKIENIYGVDSKQPNYLQAREDMVRVGMGSADIRFRGQLKEWTMKFLVKFNGGLFSAEQILNLMQYAGFSCGIGEWRPEKSGDFGTFELEQ